MAGAIYRVQGVEVQPAQRCILRNGAPIYLRAKTFQLLVYLIERPNQLVTKDELVASLWRDTAVTDNSLVQLVIELRKALGDDARHPRFIRTVPKGGYEFIAPVEEILPGGAGVAEVEEITTLEVEYEEVASAADDPKRLLPARPLHRRAALLAASAVVVCLAALYLTARLLGDKAEVVPPSRRRPVVVLPFDNQSGGRDLDWLRAGLADMLISSLSRAPRLSVLSRQQLFSLLGGRASQKAVRFEDAVRIARLHHADTVLVGSFARFGEKIRVGVEVHRVPGGQLLAAESMTADRPEEILAGMDLIALKLADHLGSPLSRLPSAAGLSMLMTNNLEAYRDYSLALERAQAYHSAEAIALLERAIALDPEFAMAHARIGYIYSVTWGQATKGSLYLERAFQLSGRLTEKDRLYIAAWFDIANLDYPQAIRRLRGLIAAYPEETEAYLRLGHLLRGEQRHQEAIDMLQRGLVIRPDEPAFYNVLGGIYMQMGRHAEAIAAEQRYAALSPDEPNAHDSLALAYQWAGNHREAELSYARALALKPDFEISVVNLGNLYYQMGRYKDALHRYQEYIRIAPSDSERARGYGCLAWIYRRTGDRRRAEEAAKNEMRYDPTSVGNAMVLALDRNNVAAARTLSGQLFARPDYSHRGARSPQRFPYYFLGQSAYRSGHWDEALTDFREALRHWPPLGAMESEEDCLADAYLKLGRLDEAIAEYRRALQVYPGEALAHYHLGVAYAQRGLPQAAQPEFTRFLSLWKEADPEIPEIAAAKRY